MQVVSIGDNSIDSASYLAQLETICMKCKLLFSVKMIIIRKIYIFFFFKMFFCLLKFLRSVLSFKCVDRICMDKGWFYPSIFVLQTSYEYLF